VFWVLIAVLFLFVFPPNSWLLPSIAALLLVVFWVTLIHFKNHKTQQLIIVTLVTTISFNLMLSTHFYPNLLKYQAGSQVGKFIKRNAIPNDMFYHLEHPNQSTDFYSQRFTPSVSLNEITRLKKGSWVVTSSEGLNQLQNVDYSVVKTFHSFQISRLNIDFLNKKTRKDAVKTVYVIEII